MELSPRAVSAVAVLNWSQTPVWGLSILVKPCSLSVPLPEPLLTRPVMLNLCAWLMVWRAAKGKQYLAAACCKTWSVWSPACCQAIEWNSCSKELALLKEGGCAEWGLWWTSCSGSFLRSGLLATSPCLQRAKDSPQKPECWVCGTWHHFTLKNRWQRKGFQFWWDIGMGCPGGGGIITSGVTQELWRCGTWGTWLVGMVGVGVGRGWALWSWKSFPTLEVFSNLLWC